MSLVQLKDPDETIPVTFDWVALGLLNQTVSPPETISSSTWTIDPTPSPPDLIVPATSPPSTSKTTTTTTALVSGGLSRKVYYVRNKIVTSLGRIFERTKVIRVEQDIGVV